MKKLLTAIFILLAAPSSFAWGRKGHTIVAAIACSNLDEPTKKNILSYLDGMTLEEASNWTDAILRTCCVVVDKSLGLLFKLSLCKVGHRASETSHNCLA